MFEGIDVKEVANGILVVLAAILSALGVRNGVKLITGPGTPDASTAAVSPVQVAGSVVNSEKITGELTGLSMVMVENNMIMKKQSDSVDRLTGILSEVLHVMRQAEEDRRERYLEEIQRRNDKLEAEITALKNRPHDAMRRDRDN